MRGRNEADDEIPVAANSIVASSQRDCTTRRNTESVDFTCRAFVRHCRRRGHKPGLAARTRKAKEPKKKKEVSYSTAEQAGAGAAERNRRRKFLGHEIKEE